MKLKLDTVTKNVIGGETKYVAYWHVTDDDGNVLEAFSGYWDPDNTTTSMTAVQATYDGIAAKLAAVAEVKSSIEAAIAATETTT